MQVKFDGISLDVLLLKQQIEHVWTVFSSLHTWKIEHSKQRNFEKRGTFKHYHSELTTFIHDNRTQFSWVRNFYLIKKTKMIKLHDLEIMMKTWVRKLTLKIQKLQFLKQTVCRIFTQIRMSILLQQPSFVKRFEAGRVESIRILPSVGNFELKLLQSS